MDLKKLRRAVGLLLIVMLVLGFSACGKGSDGEGSDPAGNDGGTEIFIGATAQSMSNEYIVMMFEAVERQVSKKYPDVRLTILDGEGDAIKQGEQLESLVGQGADVLICNPYEIDVLEPIVAQIIKDGTPVVMFGTNLRNDVGQLWCGSDSVESGEIAAEYMMDLLGGEGNLAVLRGPIGHEAEIGRWAGYENVLGENPDAKIIFDQTAEWDRTKAMTMMENWLQTGEKIDGVLAQNDEMALGALVTIEEHGLQDQIKVVGIDAIADALLAVKDGRLSATVFQDADLQGKSVVDMAVKMASGENTENTTVPYILVTQENVDEYL
jgi:inositol transport system substrate-binding protein